MITDTQRDAFATTLDNAFTNPIDPDAVTATRETLADFIAAHGKPTQVTVDGEVTVHFWSGLHCRSVFNLSRGNLYVADFGDARAAYVDRNVWKNCKA